MTRRAEPLCRERIIDAAERLYLKGGPSELTARKLAMELDVSQMAVYRHFENMAEIHGHLVDRLVRSGHPQPKQHDETWQDWLRKTFGTLHQLLIAHPDILPILGTTAHVGDSSLSALNQVLVVLSDAGFPPEQAVTAFHSLLGYTVGSSVVQHAAFKSLANHDVRAAATQDDADTLLTLLSGGKPAGLEAVARHAPTLVAFASVESWNQGLDAILKGLEALLSDAGRAEDPHASSSCRTP